MNLVKTIIDLIANTSALAQTMGDALRVRGFKPGGTVGQVPVKTGSGDFAWSWQDVAGGGASAWNDLTGTADVVPFTTSNGGPQNLGELAWDSAEETLSLQLKGGTILQIGEETLYHVENATGSTIADGTPCAYAGTVGASGKIRVKPWNGSTDQPRAFMGLATGNIADGQTGYVTHFGKVRGINTSAFSAGAILYANPSGTGLTSTEPTQNDYVIAAVVINSHATVGALLVRPAVASAASSSAIANTLAKRGSLGELAGTQLLSVGTNPAFSANNTSTSAGYIIRPYNGGLSFEWYDTDGFNILTPLIFQYSGDNSANGLVILANNVYSPSYDFPGGPVTHYMVTTSRTDYQLPPDSVVTEAADFTLSQANHWRKWVRLTKTGSTQTINLPTSGVDTGCVFQFFRATSESLAFSGGTVNGDARLADVVQNSAFGLVYLGSGTYDFI